MDVLQKILSSLKKLNAYAIGRDTHVGDTIIGLKEELVLKLLSLIIIKAHHLLETYTWKMATILERTTRKLVRNVIP
jgi:argininosuccinate synthase